MGETDTTLVTVNVVPGAVSSTVVGSSSTDVAATDERAGSAAGGAAVDDGEPGESVDRAAEADISDRTKPFCFRKTGRRVVRRGHWPEKAVLEQKSSASAR
jgi:hypothetical protein